jgi:hypothetical protein
LNSPAYLVKTQMKTPKNPLPYGSVSGGGMGLEGAEDLGGEKPLAGGIPGTGQVRTENVPDADFD